MNIFKKLIGKKEKPKDFKNQFIEWLNQGLSKLIPQEVKAFSFNLFEPAGEEDVKFGIELIEAERFDENDEDWACEEVWEPEERYLFIPIEFSGEDWENCLEVMTKLVKELINSKEPFVDILIQKPIAIGFVDGDLTIIKNS